MRPVPSIAVLAALALCACTGQGTPPAPTAPAPPRPAPEAIGDEPAVRGLDADGLTRAWGAPGAVERQPSSAVPGLAYQRWTWAASGTAPAREAVLVDGRVVDAFRLPAR